MFFYAIKLFFFKRNNIFEAEVNGFVSFEAKKSFPFVWLKSENNLVEAKKKIGSEKKRKNIT
jgi:hypothetical protein